METNILVTSIERIIKVTKKEYPDRFSHFSNSITSNELSFHYSEESIIHFNDKVFNIRDDTLKFLPKGKVSQYKVERKKHGENIIIYFSTEKPINSEAFICSVENNSIIPSLFKKIFSLWISKNEGYYYECISLLYKIFAEMQKTDYIPIKKYLHIKPAIDYIHSNFTNKLISAKELTDACGVSYAYIQKLFLQKFRLSPKNYILQLKLNYAADLLSSGLYTATQVANMCGYDNNSLFYRQFKNRYSQTPTQYIKNHTTSR